MSIDHGVLRHPYTGQPLTGGPPHGGGGGLFLPSGDGHEPELTIEADGFVTHPDGSISQAPPGFDVDAALHAAQAARTGRPGAVGPVINALPLRAGWMAVPALRWRAQGRVWMAVGLATAHANALLNLYRGTSFTAITLYVQLHTGDPGASGTSNTSAVTTRNSASFSAASAGSMSLSSSLTAYNMTATEVLTHISCHDASSSGNFVRSAALSSSKSVVNLDTFTLSTLTFSLTPIAA